MGARPSLRAAAARLRGGARRVPVCGRLVTLPAGLVLRDRSAEIPVVVTGAAPPSDPFVEGSLGLDGSAGTPRFLLDEIAVTARTPGLAAASRAQRELERRLPVLDARDRIVRAVRRFFHDRGFLEAETPARVVCPGLEPHLVALPAGAGRYLITSPELHLKRLVAAGAERVFEIARAFRGDERAAAHLTEFALLEWYRAFASLPELAADVAALLPEAARAAGRDPSRVPGCDLAAPPERVTVREAVRRHSGIDLAALRDRDRLARALERLGIRTDPADGWDDLFFRLFLERVEPHLGRGRITIIEEYPASQAALARVRDDPEFPVALRFEVYAAGVELANAFDELTDPAEQRARHERDREERRRLAREVPALDEEFLAALGHCPPCAGIALGIDRLTAIVLGLSGARDAVPFPDEV